MDTDTTRERKARNKLKKLGYKLEKTPARHWTRAHFPVGYQILKGNIVLVGAEQREYSMTLDEVFEQIAWYARSPAREAMLEVYDRFIKLGGDPDDWVPEFQMTFYKNLPESGELGEHM